MLFFLYLQTPARHLVPRRRRLRPPSDRHQISTNQKCKDAIWDLISGVSALETCHLGRRDHCLLRGQVREPAALKLARVAAPVTVFPFKLVSSSEFSAAASAGFRLKGRLAPV
jgi:hypothetical protein